MVQAPGIAPVRSRVNRAYSLNEHASKARLRELGIRIPEGELASNIDEALGIAGRIGYPVVAKAMVDGITHKTDYGLVQTNVCSDKELRAAFAQLTVASAALTGEDQRPVILVEEMIRGGLELVVGVVHGLAGSAAVALLVLATIPNARWGV